MAKRWWLGMMAVVLLGGLVPGSAQGQWPGYGPNSYAGPPGPPNVMPPMPPPWSTGGWPEYWEPPMEYEGPTWDYYVYAGWMMMTRQRPYNRAVAFQDDSTIDDGLAPPPTAPVLLRYSDVLPEANYGVRGAFGSYSEDVCYEVAGFFLAARNSRAEVVLPGELFVPFFNTPFGFIGNNFLWDNADIVRIDQWAQFINGELNVRCSTAPHGGGFEFLMGLRYCDYRERAAITTGDDPVQIAFDPTEVATYSSRSINHLMGGSLGVSTRAEICDWLLIGGELRGSWFANYVEIDIRLERLDGFVGRRGTRTAWRFSHMYEAGLFLDLEYNAWRVRGGYHVIWMLDVAEAIGQIDWDLQNGQGIGDFKGQLWWHGPSVSLELTF